VSELDVLGLIDLHRKRVAAASDPQPRVQTAYWQGRIDEFIAQNAVNEQEQAQALSIALRSDS
jgi:hypothetical protein